MESFEDSELSTPVSARAAPLLDYFSALRDPREGWRVVGHEWLLLDPFQLLVCLQTV